MNYVRDKAKVVAINDAYRLAPWADLLYFCDTRWWEWHKDKREYQDFGGIKCTMSEVVADKEPGVVWVKNGGQSGFDERTDHVRTGKNGGYQCIHLCMHLGAARIILLGYDMRVSEVGHSHWFGEHKAPNGPIVPLRQGTLDLMVPYFSTLKPELDKRGIEVINCTPGSAIECFTRFSLEQAIDRKEDRHANSEMALERD